MFNYVKVNFPNTTVGPSHVYSLHFYQTRYEHEIAILQFRDWGIRYDVVESGSPVQVTLSTVGSSRIFKGYVHHVNVDRTTGSFLTEVVVIGASMVMKNESQYVYKGLSADAIIQKIAKKYKFVAFTIGHPRIYPQVSQAGHTDWELMVRLAKQSGYSLRAENTEIYFQPLLYEYTSKRSEAPYFVMREANDPNGSTMYSFEPTIGESINYDGDMKSAIAVSGLDTGTTTPMALTSKNNTKTTKVKSSTEFFDKFHTHVVATTPSIAKHEAQAAQDRNVFPYRATVEVIGNTSLRPDMPVYLDGVGGLYTGYWTVISAEHKVIEKERNSQIYTTILTVGSDSLGPSNTWTDGKLITKPVSKPTRTVIPGVRQTAINPTSNILKTSPNLGPQSVGSFGTLNNKVKTSNNGPIWISTTATLDPASQPVGSTSQTSNRLLKKIPGIL
jgi:phage protein D